MPGFGQNPASRHSGQQLIRSLGMRELEPSPEWTGTAASGFVALPTDPVRTTAKPAVRLLVPPRQRFTNALVVGVVAFSNNGGTLIGGVDRVRFHFEGAVVDVLAPTYHRFADANGKAVTYPGYWVKLRRPALKTGEARLYVEAIPTDATMQRRVIGPFSFFPSTTLHDLEYTIDPDASISATNFHTFDAAIAAIRSASPAPANPRITFKKPMSNVPMTFAGNTFVAAGYITVDAEAPVTFGRFSLSVTTAVDNDSLLRPRAGPLWIKGDNITFDYAFVDAAFAETGMQWVLDGMALTNSLGPSTLWRGGNNSSGQRVTGNPWFLECTISNVGNPCVGANLARGCKLTDVSRDIFTDGRCVIGTRVERHDDSSVNDDAPALSVVYTGPEGTASVSRSGGPDPSTCLYTFRWGANSAAFETGRLTTYYAKTAGQGYTFADLVAWINGPLAAMAPGWAATLNDTDGRRASSGSLTGLKGQGFGNTNCKTSARQIVSNFDAHGDWYQQLFGGLEENVVVCNNLAFDMQTQNIYPSSTTSSRDMMFVNNALGNDPIGTAYFNEAQIVSQLGRGGTPTSNSHVVLAHCSMPNQGLVFRNDGSVGFSVFDAYCLIANNVFRALTKGVSTRTIGATIKDNHIHAGQTPLAEAVGTTIGGDRDSLFGDFNAGDFSPRGALLTNLKTPVVEFPGVENSSGPAPGGARI